MNSYSEKYLRNWTKDKLLAYIKKLNDYIKQLEQELKEKE